MSAGSEREGSGSWAGLRISDSDRDRIADVLSQHVAEGRLTIDELDQRLGILYAALTRGQARQVMAGLPALAPRDVDHHWHHGHERDWRPATPPDWLYADGRASRPLRSWGAAPAASPPDARGSRPVPTDEIMQAAYDAWRAAVSKAKAGRKASKRAQAAGDKAAAHREFSESIRLTAAERSRRAKFNELHKLRPDWTSDTKRSS